MNKNFCGKNFYHSPPFRAGPSEGARLQKAMEYRKSLGITENGRMFFGESDGLPGLKG